MAEEEGNRMGEWRGQMEMERSAWQRKQEG